MTPQFIDHLVFMVKDIRETENFYTAFLGIPMYFENDQLVYKTGDTRLFFVAAAEWAASDKDKSGLNHLAFGVKTDEELRDFENALNTGGIQNSGILIDKYGNKPYIWFDDPNGLRLEFYCRPSA
jgi:catechol-2,3-dioxygenase